MLCCFHEFEFGGVVHVLLYSFTELVYQILDALIDPLEQNIEAVRNVLPDFLCLVLAARVRFVVQQTYFSV
jgi:hypothetical protein